MCIETLISRWTYSFFCVSHISYISLVWIIDFFFVCWSCLSHWAAKTLLGQESWLYNTLSLDTHLRKASYPHGQTVNLRVRNSGIYSDMRLDNLWASDSHVINQNQSSFLWGELRSLKVGEILQEKFSIKMYNYNFGPFLQVCGGIQS